MSASGHWKAWVAFAEFEGSSIPMTQAAREEEFGEDDEEERYVDGDVQIARRTFERGYKDQKDKGLKQEVRPIIHSFAHQLFNNTAIISVSIYLKHGRPSSKSRHPTRA